MKTIWKITNLKRIPDNDLVIEAEYGVTFELGDEMDRRFGVVTLEGDANDPNFVPYTDLTEELVIGWVKSTLGAESIAALEGQLQEELQGRIDEKNNPEFLEENPFAKEIIQKTRENQDTSGE